MSDQLRLRRQLLLNPRISARQQKHLLGAEENLFFAAHLRPHSGPILALLEWVQIRIDRQSRNRYMDLYTTFDHQSRRLTWIGSRKYVDRWISDHKRTYQNFPGRDGFRENWPKLTGRDEIDVTTLKEIFASRSSVFDLLAERRMLEKNVAGSSKDNVDFLN